MKIGEIIRKVYPEARVISIRKFKKGVINKTYEISIANPKKDLVIRIYPSEFWKAKKENYIYGLLAKKIPTPKVLWEGKNYLLMSKIDGKELSLDRKLIKDAGFLLAKIHSIRFPYYGWIMGKKVRPKFRRWLDFIAYDFNQKSKILMKANIIDKEEIKKIRKVIEKNKEILKTKTRPCLLHKDYHSSHILVKNKKISGIIDFEWAISGHNELDIAKSCYYMFDKKKNFEKVFIEGYESYKKIDKRFDERKSIYKLLTIFSSLAFSVKHYNKKWIEYNKKKLVYESEKLD